MSQYNHLISRAADPLFAFVIGVSAAALRIRREKPKPVATPHKPSRTSDGGWDGILGSEFTTGGLRVAILRRGGRASKCSVEAKRNLVGYQNLISYTLKSYNRLSLYPPSRATSSIVVRKNV